MPGATVGTIGRITRRNGGAAGYGWTPKNTARTSRAQRVSNSSNQRGVPAPWPTEAGEDRRV
uniref:Uncharacterized protein n=1 Tax=Plectus sambesii TaxID=2011161 RepID=A0A914VA92_9BILA